MIPKISMCEYEEAMEQYQGWCTACKEFSRDSTEPDAYGYNCPGCDNRTVVGAENAMLMGLFEISEDA